MNKVKKSENLFNKTGKRFANILLLWFVFHSFIWVIYLRVGTVKLAFTPDALSNKFTLVHFERIFNEIFAPDTPLGSYWMNTLKYYFIGLVKLCLGYLVSYFFFRKVYLSGIYQVIFYLPAMFSGMVYISVFKNVINTYGPIWMLLYETFGYELPHLLSSAETATSVILFYVLWSGFGTQIMIFVGAMNRISPEVLEAAELDGCNWWRELLYMVFPMTIGIFLTYVLTGIGGILTASGPILFFTGLNEFLGTYTISFYIYSLTMEGQVNLASAISLFMGLMLFPVTIGTKWLVNIIQQRTEY